MCSYFGRMDKEFHNFEDAKQECLLDSRCIAIYDSKCDEIGKIYLCNSFRHIKPSKRRGNIQNCIHTKQNGNITYFISLTKRLIFLQIEYFVYF